MFLHPRMGQWAIALAAFASSGCASAPSYGSMLRDEASAVPTRDAREESARALALPTLDRPAYVRAVLAENPSITAAREAWRAALARVRGAGLLDDPTVSLGLAPLTIGSQTVAVGFQAAISQRFPWPEKLTLDVAVQKAEAAAAKGDFDAVRLDLAVSAATLYDAYYVAVRALEVNAAHVALLRELKASALAQYESGHGSAQDALEADMELAHMEHEAISLASARDVTVAQMNELLHRDPDAQLPPPAAMLAPPERPAARGNEAAQRPEVLSARLHAHAEAERARRARRDYFPDLTVSTSYDSLWTAPEQRWMIGLSFDLPVQYGRRVGAIDAAEAERRRYESEAERLTDHARTEITVAGKRLEEAEHVLRLYEERLVPIARAEVDAARAGFVAGRNDFATVIMAEKNLRSVELDRERARAEVDRRASERDRALGRLPGGAP